MAVKSSLAISVSVGRTAGHLGRQAVVPGRGTRSGKLVIVGSGIKAICQFTLEARAEIRAADRVYYAVADPATCRFIESLNPNSKDMYVLYDNDKMRRKTYVQMAEVMLHDVRKGLTVVGVFYGHPGVFVNPSHRAIAIARREGYQAMMLPGPV